MHNTAPRIIDVVAAVIWKGDALLAVQRPEGKDMAGFWEFPGGKVEPGESLEDALHRELKEELGLTPSETTFWREAEHDYGHIKVRLYFFHVRAFTGQPQGLEGHVLAWRTPDEACKLPFLEADAAILDALCANHAT